MLGFLCARRKTWILSSLSTFSHGPAVIHQSRIVQTHLIPHQSFSGDTRGRHYHNLACQLGSACGGGGSAASIWHAILPSKGLWRRRDLRRPAIHYELKGEGSWNAALDARPARWLHRPDSAWLLFGVCNCLAPIDWSSITNSTTEDEPSSDNNRSEASDSKSAVSSNENVEKSSAYRVTGVLADGRCLFRAIAHVACLRNGEEPPDENRQRELADELRAQVVDELLKRREESEWYIEGNFDTYVERIQQPYVWGGEPELLMASHVKKTPISVYMVDRSSGGLVNIAKYGEEYGKEKEKPINVLFHGYGHYDILESFTEQSVQKASL
ncbi:OVARIAN TUMOR DOMAIN-containing deubiquitinating enzyme 4-like [Argentina anserina]|uniref:OVARIAN TUMOR DOMAIN-containing deubiquitinating enzyme 4-like n=1 Tax=Argentina anserina TaxID=57926 RepID=UPI0021763D7D|nr:OVARIAN TUMOR DOMAIN-containing deubiquitinating enzyme 4-like [Potentilla anserina]